MRMVLAFVTSVGALVSLGALAQGDWPGLKLAAPVTAIAGLFLWRNLRDPEITRKQGRRARVTFSHLPGPGVRGPGSFARVQTHAGAWHVALERPVLPDDLSMHGTPQRGWVWLGTDGLPARVKITRGNHWESHAVTSAAPDPNIIGAQS